MLRHLEAMLGHVEAMLRLSMFGNLWLVRSFLEVMLYRYVGTLLGSFGLSWQLLKAMLGHLEAMF